MAKHGRLLVVADAPYDHREGTEESTPDHIGLSRMYMRNQRHVAREVLGMKGFQIGVKQFAHRLFVSLAIVRQKPRYAIV